MQITKKKLLHSAIYGMLYDICILFSRTTFTWSGTSCRSLNSSIIKWIVQIVDMATEREKERNTQSARSFRRFFPTDSDQQKKYKITEKYINRNKWHLGILLWGLQLTSFHGWSALEKRMKWLSTWNLNGRI